MAGTDQSLAFHPLRIAVLTICDTRTEDSDSSGALLVGCLEAAGHELAAKAVDRTMEIEGIHVTDKSGGRSGSWSAA